MMKTSFKRIISLIIVCSTLCSLFPVATAEKVDESFKDAVIENFEKSFDESEYFYILTSDKFYYEQFYDEMGNINLAKKFVTWATYSLLDKKLDKDAYVGYLVNLISMMQNDLSEISYNQSQYNQSSDTLKNITSLTLDILFANENAEDLFELSTRGINTTINISDELSLSSEQLNLIKYAVANYENQYVVLEAIKNNTTDKNLQKACTEVQEMCAYQCIYISDQCRKEQIDLFTSAGKAVWMQYGDVWAAKINSGFVSWLRSKMSSEASETVLKNLMHIEKFAGYLGYVDIGFTIGAGIMKIFVGDRVELYREQTALAIISDALTDELLNTKSKAMSGSTDERYENIKKYVALANALIYTHSRGEYCHVQSLKKGEHKKISMDYYEISLCPELESYSQDVASILAGPNNDIIPKSIKALDNVESVHLSQGIVSNYSVMGSTINSINTFESDINVTQGLSYTHMITTLGKNTFSNDIYIKSDGSIIDIYMYTNNIWIKQKGIPANDLYKFGGNLDGIEGIKFYLNSMEDITVDATDENNYKVSGEISSKDIEAALERTMGTLMRDIEDLNASDIQGMLNNLSPMKITVLIDKNTYLPVQMDIDLTDTTDSLYRNIKNIASKHGEHLTYNITTNKISSAFNQYNNLSEIFIPDEAINGQDFTIIE